MTNMYKQADLTLARRDVEKYKGRVVTVKSNNGRQKVNKFDGVITDAYPSVFTIMLIESKSCALKTYSYVDLITNSVELFLVD